jgi:hypothetical protein
VSVGYNDRAAAPHLPMLFNRCIKRRIAMKTRLTFCLIAALGIVTLPMAAQESSGTQTVSHGEIVQPAAKKKVAAPMQAEHAQTTQKKTRKHYKHHKRSQQQKKKPGAGPMGSGTSGF